MRVSLLSAALATAIAGSAATATAGPMPVAPSLEENQPTLLAPAIATGWTKAEVADRFGLPSKIWESDAWIYWNYRPASAAADEAGYDTLAVIFDAGRVKQIRLVNGVALHALIDARQRMLAQDPSLRVPSGAPRQALAGAPVAPALGKKQP
jgi:hypothetical protein